MSSRCCLFHHSQLLAAYKPTSNLPFIYRKYRCKKILLNQFSMACANCFRRNMWGFSDNSELYNQDVVCTAHIFPLAMGCKDEKTNYSRCPIFIARPFSPRILDLSLLRATKLLYRKRVGLDSIAFPPIL